MSIQNEEKEEDKDCFYESLDRLPSSSCSTSDSESDVEPNNWGFPTSTHEQQPTTITTTTTTTDILAEKSFSVPSFPMGVSKFDVWIPEPASVSERRIRLLREMGLNRDLSLSRVIPDSENEGSEIGCVTVISPSDRLSQKDQGDTSTSGNGGLIGAVKSKPDGSAGTSNDAVGGDRGNKIQRNSHSRCRSSSLSVCSSTHFLPEIDKPNLVPVPVPVPASVYSNCDCDHNVDDDDNRLLVSGKNNGGSIANSTSLHKPPTGKTRISDATCLSTSFRCSSSPGSGNASDRDGVLMELECNGIEAVDLNDQIRTIKNLDTGKEFKVNDIREDGTCNNVEEVGTGRRLTMEEFELCVGHSPIVQELMRRQNVEEGCKDSSDLGGGGGTTGGGGGGGGLKTKKKGSWLKSTIKSVAISVTGHKDRKSSDERDTSSEKGGRRSSSATDESQDGSFHGPERLKVRQYGKSCKELTALYKSQEIQAHSGSIWTIKFSLDGRYLASAGEDGVIHVWQVVEAERKGELLMDKQDDGIMNLLLSANGSPEPTTLSPRRKGRHSISRKSISLEQMVVPDTLFSLSEKPVCSFSGHLQDVLDLSWSKSQHLLSSSMDKTVRLWHLSSKTCLKIFSHSDYVTCIQFNPVDDKYFISGSLDAKVRIWSIPDRQVVDWSDLHEMVTAACYTPDGQGALVGSYKGSCRLYNTSDNKLQQKSQINLQNRKKKSHQKKITGFQFAPGSNSEVLITSADSRVRVIDGVDLVHKYKGFRNTNSQISATLTGNGKYVVSASEDSYVYVWKHEADSRPTRSKKGVTVTGSYEHFHCQDVSVAIPWPGMGDYDHDHVWGIPDLGELNLTDNNNFDEVSTANHPPTPVDNDDSNDGSISVLSGCTNSPRNGIISSATNSYLFDRFSATWPEGKLGQGTRTRVSPRVSIELNPNMLAWGMVIVTAGLRGELRTYQNFGLPVRI